jgi:DNA-binding NarL/FixJ family response regulator
VDRQPGLRGNAQGIAPTTAMPVQTLPTVTPAEDQVLQQLLQGRNNRSIAAALVLSPRTVENHISRLLAKTGCQSRTQLLLWALAER